MYAGEVMPSTLFLAVISAPRPPGPIF